METFTSVRGEKYCNVYVLLDWFGKFLFTPSIRRHEAGHDKTADGSSRDRVIYALRCRANNLEQHQSCDGCKNACILHEIAN